MYLSHKTPLCSVIENLFSRSKSIVKIVKLKVDPAVYIPLAQYHNYIVPQTITCVHGLTMVKLKAIIDLN